MPKVSEMIDIEKLGKLLSEGGIPIGPDTPWTDEELGVDH